VFRIILRLIRRIRVRMHISDICSVTEMVLLGRICFVRLLLSTEMRHGTKELVGMDGMGSQSPGILTKEGKSTGFLQSICLKIRYW
jgi:hypothetical protein